MDLTKTGKERNNKKEDSSTRVRDTSTYRRQPTGSATKPIVAKFALLVSSLSPELQRAIATLIDEIIIARETEWGSITIRFKGKKIFIDTNRKHLIK